ncbi:MAG: nitrate reductase [Planctomycetota bacterium]
MLPTLDQPASASLVPAAVPPEQPQPACATKSRAVCPYCGVGCVLEAKIEQNRLVQITAPRDAEPNRGMMCPKGALLTRVFDDPDRLTQPMMRERKGTPLHPVSWQKATRFVADRLTDAKTRRGPHSLGWYGSGQLDSEASYVFSKLFKGHLGSNHTDTNSRLCMSSAVAGYNLAFGSDGPPTCYDDLDHADTFFILGANMAANHPVLFNRIRRRKTDAPDTRIIVVDPRRSKTAEHSDLHVPVAPGGDVALLQWIARRLLDTDQLDHAYLAAHTTGWAEHRDRLAALDPAELARRAGVDGRTLEQLADHFRLSRNLLSLYCMGANQSTRGTDKNTAIINLHLMLGQVGRPGCGPFSLTGQPNAMGGREVGYLGHQLPGYRRVDHPDHRAEVEAAWGLAPGSIAPEPGRTAVPLFADAAAGKLEALWIACTNPAVSMPDAAVARRGLENTPLVIVQDITARSETAAYADVLLPACQWGEKVGTMTNSERLVVRSHRFLDPPGEARPDWWIAAAVGRAMGFTGFDFPDAPAVWDEYRKLTAGRPCDQAGITNRRLDRGPLRWPCPGPEHPGQPRRYADATFSTPDGKARFHTGDLAGPAETPDRDFPFWLTTGRVAAHWHTRTKSALAPELARQEPEPFVEIHPDDAAHARLRPGDWCTLTTRRGRATARVRVVPTLRPGVVFSTFHFGPSFAPGVNLNDLTNSAFDPRSKQPELKACAVRLDPGSAPPEPTP